VNVVPLAAFVGAGAAVSGAYALGRSVTGLRSATGLILAGVAIAAFFNSIQSYVQQTQTSSIRQVYSWILGRLVTAGWDDVLLVLPYVLLSVVVIFLHRRLLDALTLGEDEITSLGLSVRRIRLIVVVAATLGTAAVVAGGGSSALGTCPARPPGGCGGPGRTAQASRRSCGRSRAWCHSRARSGSEARRCRRWARETSPGASRCWSRSHRCRPG